MNIQVCNSFSDSVALYLPLNLFLKPFAKINISIQLPSSKALGKTISNWELMERMREIIQPEQFTSLKVVKSTTDTIRFEGEIDDKKKLERIVANLDERSLKLSGYPDALRLKASEAKLDFPSRHSWDSFFRDAPNMDEMKPGERPDTIHVCNLPIKWFINNRDSENEDLKPSENIFRRVLERFGKVRYVDIPICDPYRKQMKAHMTGMSTFSYDSDLYFEGYVQFTEYVGFVRAMDAFRGMKLLKKDKDGAGHTISIRVDFDKSKHLSEASLKRRSIVRERLVAREKQKEEKEKEETQKKQKKEEAERRKLDQKEREKLTHMQEREERRKAKQLAKLKAKEASEINSKIAEEQKKLIKTQRKLQSIRLIEELFRRIQLKQKHTAGSKKEDLRRDLQTLQNSKHENDNRKELRKLEKALLEENREKSVRDRLVNKYKNAQVLELEEQRQKVRMALEGNIILRSVLDTGKKRLRTSSISSLSSGSDIFSPDEAKVKVERFNSPEHSMMMPKEDESMRGAYPPPSYSYGPYGPYLNHSYSYQPPVGYFPRSAYYPQEGYSGRGRGGYPTRRPRGAPYRGRGYHGQPQLPFFAGPNANQAYYKYFKKLTERNSDDRERSRSYSRSRSRSRRRSYSRSSSRSRRRSRHSRSRSRHSRSRSRNRRTRTRSRSRSRSSRSRHSRRRSRSKSHERSKSMSRSRSRHRKSKSRSHNRESKPKQGSPEHKAATDFIPRAVQESLNKEKSNSSENQILKSHEDNSNNSAYKNNGAENKSSRSRARTKSWSLPKDASKVRSKSWSRSPTPKK